MCYYFILIDFPGSRDEARKVLVESLAEARKVLAESLAEARKVLAESPESLIRFVVGYTPGGLEVEDQEECGVGKKMGYQVDAAHADFESVVSQAITCSGVPEGMPT